MKLLLSFTFLCFLAIHTKAQTDHFNLIDWQTLTETQINLLPMFGQKPKTEKEQIADKIFIENLNLNQTHKDIRYKSDKVVEAGWVNYYSGTLDTAMFRFNQAWLIDSTNIGPYIGFSTVYTTLGDSGATSKFFEFVKRNDNITSIEFQKNINQNIGNFRKLESQSYNVTSDYKPIQYYSTGQLFIERKKLVNRYSYNWYHKNGSLLRQVVGGENPHDWKGVVVNYHDNGVIAHKGKWNNCFFNPSIWTTYDREGKVSKIEYWRKKVFSNNYVSTKTIIYSQEMPWNKGNYVVISESGWIKTNSKTIYPDGYIQEIYNFKDPLYKYYTIWKDGKISSDLIKVIPDDCLISNSEGNFEWFQGKLYRKK